MDNADHTPAPKKAKVIADYGVNSAYLEAGETCVSYKHGLCALIVVSNGQQTFVTHQARPDLENLVRELKKVKNAMDGPLHVQLFQTDIHNTKDRITRQYLEDISFGLNLIFPAPAQFEKNPGNFGSYLIDAKGQVQELGLDTDPAYRHASAAYQQDFHETHRKQPVVANQAQRDMHNISIFNYGDVPVRLMKQKMALKNSPLLPQHFITTENLGEAVERWNNEAVLANYEHEKAFPGIYLEQEDRLHMHPPEDDNHYRESYEAYGSPSTVIGGPKGHTGPSLPDQPHTSRIK